MSYEYFINRYFIYGLYDCKYCIVYVTMYRHSGYYFFWGSKIHRPRSKFKANDVWNVFVWLREILAAETECETHTIVFEWEISFRPMRMSLCLRFHWFYFKKLNLCLNTYQCFLIYLVYMCNWMYKTFKTSHSIRNASIFMRPYCKWWRLKYLTEKKILA